MVLIKGTGRGKCTCGTPTEIEMQNIRDASEEAVREAREALRIAGDAKDIADDAQDTADNAQNTANNAQNTANNAQDTADNAQNIAENAQNTAENAQNTAENAQNTANNAQNTANNAQNTANNAQNTANNAQDSINDIVSGITIVGRANYSTGSTNSIYSQYAKQLNNSIKHQQISVLSGTADVWHWGKIVMVSLRNLTIPPGTTEMLRGQIPIPHRTDPPGSIVCISYGRIGVNDSSDYAELEIRTIYDGTTKGYINVTTRGSGNCTGSATLIYMSFFDSEHE